MRQEEHAVAARRYAFRRGDRSVIRERIRAVAEEPPHPVDAGARRVLASEDVVPAARHMRALGIPLPSGLGVSQGGRRRQEDCLGRAQRVQHLPGPRDPRRECSTDVIMPSGGDKCRLRQPGLGCCIGADRAKPCPALHQRWQHALVNFDQVENFLIPRQIMQVHEHRARRL